MIELNKIYNMDCIEGMNLMFSQDLIVDAIITDPPYGINYKSNWTDHHNYIKNDSFDEYIKCLPVWFSLMKNIISDSGVCCCCCCGGGKLPVSSIFTIEAMKYFYLIQTLIWKKFIGLGWRYRPAYETIIILSKSKDNYSFYDTSKKCSNVIEGINQDIPINGEHPTQKPIKLMEHLIKIHTKENDIILDPFMGSGTTAIACLNLNRKYIGFELDKGYYDIANKRIDDYNKQLKLF